MADYLPILSRHFSFWDKLSQQEKDLILRYTSVVQYKKGTHLQRGDSNCVGVLLLNKGILRVYMLSEEGKEITLYRLYENDVCVLSASCILQHITFDVYIDAETDVEILLINAAIFSQIAEQNTYVECFSYKLATDRFSDVMWAMQQILFMSFDKRLAIFLADEIAKSGADTIKMTHEQVAKYMGGAREVVTRMLNYFAGEGIVELSRGSIKIIDKKKLKKLI